MEDAVKASSWKPTSPIMAAMSEQPPAPSGMSTPSVAMRSLAGQGMSTPYWSPSTHTTTNPADAQEFVPGRGAAEFVPGGGAAEFVPGVGVQQQSQEEQQVQQQVQQQQQQQSMLVQGGGGGDDGGGGGQIDARLYDQHIQEQGGATYSEAPLVQPAPKKKTIGSFFMSDRLQERYQHLNECTLRELAPQDPKIKLIPTGYTSIYPLDAPGRDDSSTAGSFGYP